MSAGYFISTSKIGDDDRSRFNAALSSGSNLEGQRPTAVTPLESAFDARSTTSKVQPSFDMDAVDDEPLFEWPTLQEICAAVVMCAFLLTAAFGLDELMLLVETARVAR